MKKILSWLVLAVMVITIAGYLPLYKIMQNKMRTEVLSEIQRGIPVEQLRSVCFENGEKPNWSEMNREFIYKGHLYDVVRKVKHGNTTEYLCVDDVKESCLNRKLNDMVRLNSNDENTKSGKTTVTLLKILTQTAVLSNGSTFVVPDVSHGIAVRYSFVVKINLEKPPSPPPDLC